MREMRKRRLARLRDIEFLNPNICYCAPDVPEPDPAIGQAAKSNVELGKEQAAVAREQLAWEKDRAAKQDPLIEKIVNQQIAAGDANAGRAESQWQIYRDLFAPVEEKMVQDANNFDSDERKSRMAAEAAADVGLGYQGAREQNERAMGRMGVNPNSGRFQALQKEASLGQAKDTAGAMNKARRDTELLGMSQRQSVANFGRNMPNTGLAADAAALNAGNSATGNMASGAGIHNAGMNSAQNWFGGAQSGNTAGGNLMLGQHNAQLQSWQANQERLAGLGQLAGMGGSMALMAMRKGGMVRHNAAYRLTPGRYSGGLGSLKRKGYAEGGMISGPGTGTSDSIPASIEGKQPIRLSNGEAVLNEEAVNLVGEDFIHRINAGGLAMLNKGGA
ncbi:hypothetical protein [Nitrosovibrio sp. Nv4]|uniref:hypothetical protein n=1 Tax=Nitrosovibrio sp. Nv4 TaxID=1945880 RepID=UPI000BDDD403|nr:hypothetical protein [Nitrosovibrio sp. Nv4]SOD42348.1 hypothetical protein SAMN06298226_2687 [Nitrosovibrio sp. Nv4]